MQDWQDHRQAWLERIATIARDAGALVLEVYATDFAVRGKGDRRP